MGLRPITIWCLLTLVSPFNPGSIRGVVAAASFDESETSAPADSTETEQPADKRTLEVTVLGPDDEPLAGAKIHAAIWSADPALRKRDYVCDEAGRATVELPQGEIEILRLWALCDGHVSLFAQWWPKEEPVRRDIPKSFCFVLSEGTFAGGVIQNEDGQPIAGARVQVQLVNPRGEQGLHLGPIPNIWLAEGDDACVTDNNGRWILDNAPEGDEFDFRVMVSHPDYVSDATWGELQQEAGITARAFRDETAAIVMHRGIKLSGTVRDDEGRALPDAAVIWGDDPYFQPGSQEVRTNAQGQYQLPPAKPGMLKVTVVAVGWAPDQREIDLAGEPPEGDFTLTPGVPLRLQFVDENGDAVRGVAVGITRWRGGKALYNHRHPNVLDTKIPVIADATGLYEWTWAPADDVAFQFYKKGYTANRDVLVITAKEDTTDTIELKSTPGVR